MIEQPSWSHRLCPTCDVRWKVVDSLSCWMCGGSGKQVPPMMQVGMGRWNPEEGL